MIAVIPTIGDIVSYLNIGLERGIASNSMDENLRAKVMIIRIIPGMISQIWAETAISINPRLVMDTIMIDSDRA